MVMKMNVEGSRRRPKKKWLHEIKSDMRIAGVCVCVYVNDVRDRFKWKFRIYGWVPPNSRV